MGTVAQRRRARKLIQAKADLEFYRAAEKAIVGGAQQYSEGSRSVSKASLAAIQSKIDELEDIIDAFEYPGGRFQRVVPLG